MGVSPRPALVLVALAVAAFLAIGAAVAVAAHYHTVNNRSHGVVHGDSTTDGYFFGRTNGYYLNDANYCYVGDTDIGLNYGAVSYNADLCSVWTGAYYYSINECRGASFNQVNGTNGISGHYHYAHSYGGNCPRTIN